MDVCTIAAISVTIFRDIFLSNHQDITIQSWLNKFFCTCSQEQITLWGGLLAILALISAIVFCRRKDFSLDFTKLLSFGCCCSSPTEKGLHEKNEDRSVQVTKQSFLKKCNKVGTLDTYSNAPVTVNKLKDCVDQKNTNENSFFIKQHLVIDERNVQSLGKHKQLSQPQSMLARVQ